MWAKDVILHEDGEFRLLQVDRAESSCLAHRCHSYPPPAKEVWWYLPSPLKCFMCGAVPSDEIRGLYNLHNWDRLQAVK